MKIAVLHTLLVDRAQISFDKTHRRLPAVRETVARYVPECIRP